MPKSRYPKSLSEWLREQGVKVKLAPLLEVADRVLPIFIVNPKEYPGSIFEGGKLKDNYEELGAVDDHSFTVPAGKRWKFTPCGYLERDTSATLEIAIYDPDDNKLFDIDNWTAATSNLPFPKSFGSVQRLETFKRLILDAGYYLKATWGATQTSPVVCWIVYEVDA